MDLKQGIRSSLAQSDFVVNGYLADLTPKEMMARSCPGVNHISWQLGHLIQSERYLVNQIAPGKMDSLPEGFEARHKKDTASVDDAGRFLSKDEYLQIARQVRGQTLQVLDSMQPADFDKPAEKVPPFCKTAGDVFTFLGPHWLMHAGQWAVIRRSLGRAPLF
jgi:hypothetical protein